MGIEITRILKMQPGGLYLTGFCSRNGIDNDSDNQRSYTPAFSIKGLASKSHSGSASRIRVAVAWVSPDSADDVAGNFASQYRYPKVLSGCSILGDGGYSADWKCAVIKAISCRHRSSLRLRSA
jgi:hypothetical protein